MTTEPIRKVFFELLQFRRMAAAGSIRLAGLRHNRDLCPLLQRRCELVLTGLERHQSVVYDVQGPSDSGVDVMVRLNDGPSSLYIAFQVKADDEVQKGIYEKLKAQWVDAKSTYGERLLDYYILLAWNESQRKDQIRLVEQSFAGIPEVKVIEPGFAATFLLDVTPIQIAALTSGFLSAEDPLLTWARAATRDWTSRQATLFVELLARHLEGEAAPTLEQLRRASFVQEVYGSTQALFYYKGVVLPPGLVAPQEGLGEAIGDPFEHLDSDLDALGDDIVVTTDDRYQLGNTSDAVMALSYELKARHQVFGDRLREGLLQLLSPVAELTAMDIVHLILELEYSTDLGAEELVELIGGVLEINYPYLAESASDYGLGQFDPLLSSEWVTLAGRMVQEAGGVWEDGWEEDEDESDESDEIH